VEQCASPGQGDTLSAISPTDEAALDNPAYAALGGPHAGIQRRSERVFLHVLVTNTAAIGLYEELGFHVRQTATLTVVTREQTVPG
jgi:ribosomal protein S18 acetylase RimI-like enzyme